MCHRHAHYQARATVRRALGVDFSAVQVDDLAAHIQTQSHPAVVAAIVGLEEPVKDLLEFARRPGVRVAFPYETAERLPEGHNVKRSPFDGGGARRATARAASSATP